MNHKPDRLSVADRESYELLARSCAQVPAPDRVAIAFAGADAVDWLQGQVSNDLREVPEGKTLEACFLDATGHVRAPALLGRFADRTLAIVPADTVEYLAERFERSVFMEDVSMARVEGTVVALFGPTSDTVMAEWGWAGESHAIALPGEGVGLRRPAPSGGWLVVGKVIEAAPIATPAAAEAVRLELGLPAWGRDFGPKTLLPEMGAAFTCRNVSYAKGCYLGQEVVMRIRSRGHTNRTWVGLVGERPMEVGAPVHSESRKNAGTVTSTAVSPARGPIAAAMLANAATEPGTRVVVDSADGPVPAVVLPFPLRESL